MVGLEEENNNWLHSLDGKNTRLVILRPQFEAG